MGLDTDPIEDMADVNGIMNDVIGQAEKLEKREEAVASKVSLSSL